MIATFDPEDGERLIDTQEGSPPITETITVTVGEPEEGEDEDELVALVWTTDLPEIAHVTASWGAQEGTFTVAIENAGQLFPVSISYLLDRVLGTTTSFGDLPAAAEEVISYTRPTASHFTYSLTVTAKFLNSEDQSATYTIRVVANCDGGRDALVAAVNARR